MNAGDFPVPMFALSTLMEYLLLIGAILFVAGAVMFWAVALRKPPGERRCARLPG